MLQGARSSLASGKDKEGNQRIQMSTTDKLWGRGRSHQLRRVPQRGELGFICVCMHGVSEERDSSWFVVCRQTLHEEGSAAVMRWMNLVRFQLSLIKILRSGDRDCLGGSAAIWDPYVPPLPVFQSQLAAGEYLGR